MTISATFVYRVIYSSHSVNLSHAAKPLSELVPDSIVIHFLFKVSLPSLGSYVTGVPLMSGIYTVSQIQLLPSPPDPGSHMVEVKKNKKQLAY